VLGVAIVLEAASFRTAIREASKVRRRHSWWQFIRAAKSPELPVVLLEDFGALIGLLFAIVGITLSELTGEPAFDALGSIAIGLLLGVIAVVLAIEMKSLLIGEAAAPADEQAIADAIEADPQVERLIHLRTQHLGPEELLVAAKVELDTASLPRLGAAIDDLERRIRGAVPAAQVIYIEPDEYRPGESDDDPE
jgi:divalent metal cation (Fe/Co/Zn/Cd) transporter